MTDYIPNPNEKEDNKRLLLAIVVSLAILLGYNFFFANKQAPQPVNENPQAIVSEAKNVPTSEVVKTEKFISRKEAVSSPDRIMIRGDKVSGSISLKGARIDDISLNDYFKTINNKENVELLLPAGTGRGFYVESGWVVADSSLAVPNAETKWHLAKGSKRVLSSGDKIKFEWDNGQGFLFTREFSLDENYMLQITESVTNNTKVEKQMNAWHLISRHSLPEGYKGMSILHEGPIVYLNKKLKEIKYKDLAKGEIIDEENVRGWVGFTDTYWFTGLLPSNHEIFNARVLSTKSNNKDIYQVDIMGEAQKVLPGKTIADSKYLYVGAKKLNLVKAYQDKFGFEKLDLAFDFGMFYFITKPFYILLHFFADVLGDVGLAIIFLTLVIRGAMYPLASKSFRSMAKMKLISPKVKELQEKYKDDKQKLQMEIFELYKREDTNPFSGCWPMLIQIPIFFSLYKSILLSIELRHAPFWGWIHDLSAADPTNIFTLFGLLPIETPAFLTVGAWPALFCITMILQKRLSPPMPDKTQEQMQAFFPYFMTIMLAKFAVGLVIYWTFSNLLGLIQQYLIQRSMGNNDVSLVRGHKDRHRSSKNKKAEQE